jgi:hypothetical protein
MDDEIESSAINIEKLNIELRRKISTLKIKYLNETKNINI